MASRENKFTIYVRYNRNQQIVTYRGVGVYARINMSTLAQVLQPHVVTGGADKNLYWAAILNQVATALLSAG